MAPDPADRVDAARLADEAAVLERSYPLAELPRLRDVLADTQGTVRARFAFKKFDGGRIGATVQVEAAPHLVCQRCLKGFELATAGGSEVELVADEDAAPSDPEREAHAARDGLVSLRDLAEEELLLSVPLIPACAAPATCGNAPEDGDADEPEHEERTRPFAGLKEMLKKTR